MNKGCDSTTPRVSIIVPCYNQEACLAEALESVLAQNYPHWECIVINDGSTDSSEAIALEYVRRDRRFRYIYQENQGVVASRNNAIAQSVGKYILPLDGDDKIAPDYVGQAIAVLERDDNVKIVYGRVELFGEASGEYILQPYSLPTLLVTNCITNSSLFRRSDFNACGGYNPNMAGGWEDWDLWVSLLEHGGTVHRLTTIGNIYRISKFSRTTDAAKKSYALREQLWKNHLPLYQQEFFRLWQFHQDITGSRLFVLFRWMRQIKRKLFSLR